MVEQETGGDQRVNCVVNVDGDVGSGLYKRV